MNRFVLCFVAFVLSGSSLLAATVTEVVPVSGPRGARVMLVGSDLAAGDLAVTFPAAEGGRVNASVVFRSATNVELTVPSGAISGEVHVTHAGSTIKLVIFTVTSGAPWVTVATIPSEVRMAEPSAVWVTADGRVLVVDAKKHRVSVRSPGGPSTVIAGSGNPGFVDGPAVEAALKEPRGIVHDARLDVIYVADTGNHAVRRIQGGVMTTLAGSGKPGDRDGRGSGADFKSPIGLALDDAGNLYVVDSGNHKLRVVTPHGAVTTIAGAGRPGHADGVAGNALFKEPEGVAVTADGTIFVADTKNYVIRRIREGIVTTIAGTMRPGTVDGPASQAEFGHPSGIALDAGGHLYIGDTKAHRVRMIDLNRLPLLVTTVAGSGTGGLIDGAPSSARFRDPAGLAVQGAIYVADAKNGAIRVVYPGTRLTDLYPRNGRVAGMNDVRIFGVGFVPGETQVSIGSVPAVSITFVTSTELIVTCPPQRIGSVATADVSVVTPAGSASLSNAYRYLQPPTVASVLPRKGKTAGGETVTVRGTDFGFGGTEFLFGSALAPSPIVDTESSATVTTPPGPPGPVAVMARTASGEGTLSGGFEYFPPPTIAGFVPGSGGPGTTVILHGTHFDDETNGNSVRFAGTEAAVLAATATEIQTVVPLGAQTGRVEVTTAGGTALSPSSYVVANYTGLSLAPTSIALRVGAVGQMVASASVSNGSTEDVSATAVWTVAHPSIASVSTTGRIEALSPGTTSITAAFSGFTAVASVQVTNDEPPPPDPVLTAPPIDATRPTLFGESIEFLYNGPNATQRGLTPGAIVPRRVAVIRGRVLDAAGGPLPGVRVSVFDIAATGYTISRGDGFFDLVVNGGGVVVLEMEKNGLITVHRRVTTPWQDFVAIDETKMIPYDSEVTPIDLPQLTAVSVARGSSVTDEAGTRRATILFEPGTGAAMRFADGTSQVLTRISVRATEQTVGRAGAMPAELPQESGYTYCVELSVDEAVAAGATSVELTRPVFVYVENFLGFRTGSAVPAGYYDRQKAEWIASDNGRVVRIVAIEAGLATIDSDGDGAADDALALSVGERSALASLYAAGQTLWRVPVTHFTPWDCNWPFTLPAGAVAPAMPTPVSVDPVEGQSCQQSSIIECESLTLGKSVPISGTPFTLEYRSRNADGFTANRELIVTMTGATLPPLVKRVELEIEQAGQRSRFSFPPELNQSHVVSWNGADAYHRKQFTRKNVKITLGYVYDAYYVEPAPLQRAFGAMSDGPVTPVIAREEGELQQKFLISLGGAVPEQGLGDWTLSPIHAYDSAGKTLLLGNGSMSKMEARGLEQKKTAPSLTQFEIRRATVGPDGSIYTYQGSFGALRRISPEGIVTTVAGGGTRPPANGGLAAGSSVLVVEAAIHPSGDVILLDQSSGSTVYRVRDGVLQTLVSVPGINNIAAGQDGLLYYIESSSLKRIDAGGNVSTVAAADANTMYGMVRAGLDGALYVTVGRFTVTPTRIGFVFSIEKLLRSEWIPVLPNYSHFSIHDIWADASGTVWYTWENAGSGQKYGINVVHPDRTVRPLATTTAFGVPFSVAKLPDGRFVYTELKSLDLCDPDVRINDRCLVAASEPIGTSNTGGFLAKLPMGTGAFQFSMLGKHTETRNALTGTLVHRVGYDFRGLVSGVEDADGLMTRVERSANGEPLAIVAPNGDRTTLQIDGAGHLISIEGPGAQRQSFDYTPDGLLEMYRDAGGIETTYTYDANGRLARAEDAGDGTKSLTYQSGGGLETTRLTTAMGRAWEYTVRRLDVFSTNRTVKDPNGLLTVSSTSPVATTVVGPDGTIVVTQRKPDAQWGSMAPLTSLMAMQLPSGRSISIQNTRSVTLSDPANPFSVTSSTETSTIVGRQYRTIYTAGTRTIRTETPLGRAMNQILDAKGRIVTASMAGITPLSLGYDARGRVASVGQGSRQQTYQWNERDLVASVTDPLQRTTHFGYDGAGRMTSQTLPGGRVVLFSYDETGNLVSVTPPGRPAHGFDFTPVGLLDLYRPPAIDGAGTTRYQYNPDRELTRIINPDDTAIDIAYTNGRPAVVTTPGRTLTFGYDDGGRLASVSDSAGVSTSYAWDGFLPTGASWSGAVSGHIAWGYDNELRPASETVNGSSVTLGYDQDSLVTRVGAIALNRDPQNGRLTGTTLGTVTDALAYNPAGDLAGYVATHSATQLFSAAYTRDLAGRITGMIETMNGVSGLPKVFEYDSAGRLSRVTSGGMTTAEYEYDANGNRTAHRWPGGANAGTYDDQDRLLAYGGTAYTYTAGGDLRSRTLGGETTTFEHDTLGNLRRVVLGGGRTIDYVVDGQNRRVGRRVDGALVQSWLYSDQLRIVAELDGTGALVSRFVYGSRANVPDYMIKEGVTYRILSDHLGSPRLVINIVDGSIVQRLGYDVFGAIESDTNPGFQPFGFAGGLYDRDTGLVRFGARDYDPHTGRFVSKDPIGFAGGDANLYAYAINDPVNLIDPMGTDWLDALETVANFSAGFGDTLTFGATNWIRDQIGGNEGIDRCSGAYAAGMYTELGLEVAATGGSGLLRGAAARASRSVVRAEAARLTRGIARNGNQLHHVNPLFGHPGSRSGQLALFPTGGLPAPIHSGSWNLKLMSPSAHGAAHRSMRQMESIGRTIVNPATTAARATRSAAGICGCP